MSNTWKSRSRLPAGRPESRGFTLVELLVVIVILGILAAVVLPTINNVSDEARQAAFIAELRTFVDSAIIYHVKTGEHVPDGGSGEVPGGGFEDYLDGSDWVKGTPIGGVWDTEFEDAGGVTSALGVHYWNSASPGDQFMTEIDVTFDDGDLTAGGFQKLGDGRFYYILAR